MVTQQQEHENAGGVSQRGKQIDRIGVNEWKKALGKMCVMTVCESLFTCLSDPEPTASSSSARRFSNSAIYRDKNKATHGWQWQQLPTRHTQTPTHIPSCLLSCLLPFNIVTSLSRERKQKSSSHYDFVTPFIQCTLTVPWPTHWIFPARVCCVTHRVPLHLGP